jgi:Ni,Fe-hydrogenase I small subunit
LQIACERRRNIFRKVLLTPVICCAEVFSVKRHHSPSGKKPRRAGSRVGPLLAWRSSSKICEEIAMPNEIGATRLSEREQSAAIREVHILWITGGLSCDGDSVSITAATQPSIEDVMLGAIPGLPKVYLHNAVLAYEVGDEFMAPFHKAARGELDNYVVVMEGSIPNE